MKNYNLADEILEKVKSSKKILITSHASPDMDSLGSILSCYLALKHENKDVDVVLTDAISNELRFLPGSQEIKQQEVAEIDFKKYDLLIFLDSATLGRVTHKFEPFSIPADIDFINIDHHATNDKYAKINLITPSSSTCEILYNLYKQWNIKITKDMAICLLTGIVGDTGGFQYVDHGETLRIAGELIDLGASTRLISLYTFRTTPLEKLKFWGLCLSKMEKAQVADKRYVWTAINFEDMNKAGGKELKQGAESFFNSVEDTDFGVLLTEQEKGILSGSFRARTDIDVSRAAQALGGGGHKGAAGFRIILGNMSFEEGVKKVHSTIKDAYGKE